jgi:hypothetical protein
VKRRMGNTYVHYAVKFSDLDFYKVIVKLNEHVFI